MPRYKSAKATVDDNGRITAYAATFTREPDWVGDVIAKGAFSDWLAEVKSSGAVLPMLYNHDQSLDNFIGRVTDIAEDDHGLLFTAEFDATDNAQHARKLAQDGRLSKLSFAYEVLDEGAVTLEDGRKANELRKLNVSEVSLVLNPCNPDTSVVEVKSGRRNSKADADELRGIREDAQHIITAVDGLLADDADADEGAPEPGDEPGKDDELEDVKSYAAAVVAAIETLKEG